MPRWLGVCLLGLLTAACTGSPLPPTVTQVGTAPPAPASTVSPTSATTVIVERPAPTSSAATIDDREDERLEMVESQIEGRGVADPLVLAAVAAAPRHRFVPENLKRFAYRDHPLPIGYGQTISQPYIVALMTEALGLRPGDKVLEIGTGSGYQAAVLAEMDLAVYTIEIVPELAARAGSALEASGYEVSVRTGDGYFGWPEEAPFDGIIVTAAPDHVPQPLVDQLAPGAVMVIPVGPIGAVQTLWRFSLDPGGEPVAESLGWVRFVPFTRAEE